VNNLASTPAEQEEPRVRTLFFARAVRPMTWPRIAAELSADNERLFGVPNPYLGDDEPDEAA
jgi:hypothetical protein